MRSLTHSFSHLGEGETRDQAFASFYLVRHGETDWNARGIIQGQQDSRLTPEGEAQTEELAAELRDVPFDAVFSSDLGRAVQTAEILARQHGLLVQTTPLLRERAFGRYEGQPAERLPRRDELFSGLTTEERFRFKSSPDVESDQELVNRALRFLQETTPLYTGKTVLVVTHGGLMRVLLTYLGFGSHEGVGRVRVANGAVVTLVSQNGTLAVAETNGVASSQEEEHAE